MEHRVFDCQVAPPPSPNEPVAVVAVLRFLGDEAGLVGGGGYSRSSGSIPLEIISLPIWLGMLQQHRLFETQTT